LAEHSATLGAATLQRLREMQERHPLIGHVAGLGLHIGIDLVTDRTTKERAVDEAEIVMFKCLERGLSFKTIDGNVLTLRPALVIARQEMDRALDILEQAIEEVEGGGSY
jgi:4-aminobutyrate aminotransferase